MPEQPQWSERTLDMPPQDPWADPPTAPGRTAAIPPGPAPTSVFPPGNPPGPAPTSVQPGGARPGPAPISVQPAAAPGAPGGGVPAEAQPNPFSRGRAQVNSAPRAAQQHASEHEPTGTGWPGADPPTQRHPLSWHVRELRKGGEWTSAALLFAFVCWGIWAISTEGDLTTPIVVFVCSLLVAAGLFALCRVIGRFVLERQLHRVRRTARGSHLVTALFLVGVGLAHLQQTEWVMNAYHWIVGP